MNDDDNSLTLRTSLVFVIILYTSTGVLIVMICSACSLRCFLALVFESFLKHIPIPRHSKTIRDNMAAVARPVNMNKALIGQNQCMHSRHA